MERPGEMFQAKDTEAWKELASVGRVKDEVREKANILSTEALWATGRILDFILHVVRSNGRFVNRRMTLSALILQDGYDC